LVIRTVLLIDEPHLVAGEFAAMNRNALNADLTGSGGHRPARETDHEEIPMGEPQDHTDQIL
jgi:hypothetical protein